MKLIKYIASQPEVLNLEALETLMDTRARSTWVKIPSGSKWGPPPKPGLTAQEHKARLDQFLSEHSRRRR